LEKGGYKALGVVDDAFGRLAARRGVVFGSAVNRLHALFSVECLVHCRAKMAHLKLF
jgi:hypothetical protein